MQDPEQSTQITSEHVTGFVPLGHPEQEIELACTVHVPLPHWPSHGSAENRELVDVFLQRGKMLLGFCLLSND